jgi:hypothetical protein
MPLEASKAHVDPISEQYKQMGLGNQNFVPSIISRTDRKELK